MTQAATDRLMRIAVSGSSGLVGSALCDELSRQGRDVIYILREHAAPPNSIAWDTTNNTFDAQALSRCDAVVHLAGENILGRWSDEKLNRIYASRVDSTRALAQSLAALEHGPRTLVVASAVGYYGNTGQENARTEEDPHGEGFLADVCVHWEQAADPARQAGIRVVHMRIGVVLSSKGGALKQMLLPFKLGVGGPVGSGDQYMSWITLHDLVRVLIYAIDTPSLSGPVNAVAPEPVTSRKFAKALGRVLHRPAVLPAPSFALKLLYGKSCAEQIVLASIRAVPKRLADMGFVFDQSDLETALKHELQTSG